MVPIVIFNLDFFTESGIHFLSINMFVYKNASIIEEMESI